MKRAKRRYSQTSGSCPMQICSSRHSCKRLAQAMTRYSFLGVLIFTEVRVFLLSRTSLCMSLHGYRPAGISAFRPFRFVSMNSSRTG